MNINIEFLTMEANAAQAGIVPPDFCHHPTFQALHRHELELDRPALTTSSFLDPDGSWSLRRLADQLEQISDMIHWLEQESPRIEQALQTRLERYTEAPIPAGLQYVLYAGGTDGGFAPDSNALYLNMTLYSRHDTSLDTLAHECYHAREKGPSALEKREEFSAREPLQRILMAAAEEGIATLVQFDGLLENGHAAKRYRPAPEGAAQLCSLLTRYIAGGLTGAELESAFFNSDCCYSAGLYIAHGVWDRFGREGLELWSRDGSLDSYMQKFASCPQAVQWPSEALDMLLT